MNKKALVVMLVIVMIFIIIISVSKNTATAPVETTTPSPTISSETNGTSSPLTITQILNTTVPAEGSETGEMIVLKNGAYDGNGLTTDLLTATSSYTSLDFNNDGAQDLLAVIGSNTGGTGYFFELLAFLNDHGKPQYSGRLFLGDRIEVNSITSQNGIITVDIITQGPNDGMCCATMKQVKKYTYDVAKKEFVEI